MNEEQIKEIENEVGRPDPEFEVQWAKAAIVRQKAEEKVMQSAWRMWKFTRNDQRMEEVKNNLDQIRSCIKYLEGLLNELGDNS